jgi:cysteinyl-tRNA synthetase
VNSFLNAEKPPDIETMNKINGFYEEFGGGVLGLVPSGIPAPQSGLAEDALMSLLIELRSEARNRKLWDIADIIRDRLQQLGIVLEDGKEGTRWKKFSS